MAPDIAVWNQAVVNEFDDSEGRRFTWNHTFLCLNARRRIVPCAGSTLWRQSLWPAV